MQFRKLLLLGIGLSLIVGCKTNALVNSTKDKAITGKIQTFINENDLPGLNFSIINKNGKTANYSQGFEDVENRTSLTTNQVFFSGSIGKTYAAALLMQLVDEGKVDLNSKLKTYFPEVGWLSKVPNIEEITIEMLLQHTSGLPRWVMQLEVWEVLHTNPDKIWSYEDRLAYVFNQAPVHEAGKGWAYSDTNYILIGILIEKMSGEYYYDLVRTKILKPFKLKHTYPSEGRTIPNLSMAYSRLPEAFKIPNKVIKDGQYVFNPQIEWTGGSMASTTTDLAKWAKIYFEGELFSKELLTKITTINPNGDKVDAGHSYGMGSFIYHTNQGDVFGHSGFMPGYNSIFAYYPNQKIAVAIQINCDYAGTKMQLTDYLEVLMPIVVGNN